MLGLFIYTFAAFGVVYVVGHSAISRPARVLLAGVVDESGAPVNAIRRWLITLVECPACLGFWFGVAVAHAGPEGYAAAIANVPPLALGFYTAGANYVLGRLTGLME